MTASCNFGGLGLQLSLNTFVFFCPPGIDIDPAWQVSSISKSVVLILCVSFRVETIVKLQAHSFTLFPAKSLVETP